MAFVEESSNTPSGGGVRWFLPDGTTVASATSISFANCNSAVILSGSTPIQTITDFEAGEVFVVRPAAGASITFVTGGNIARAATLLQNLTYVLWNDGGTIYPMVIHNAVDIPFTPDGTISATNVQAAIVEVRNEAVLKAGDTMTGPLLIGDGTSANPSLALSGDTNSGWRGNSTNKYWVFVSDGTDVLMLDANLVRLGSSGTIEFSATTDPTAALDLFLKRGGARRIDVQGDGTNASGLRVWFDGTTQTKYWDISGTATYTYVSNTGNSIVNVPTGSSHDFRVNNTSALIVGAASATMSPATTFTNGLTSSGVANLNGNVVVGSTGSTLKNVWYTSTSWDIPNTLAGTSSSTPVTVNGAAVGDIVTVVTPDGLVGTAANALVITGSVTAANTVTLRATNPTAGALNPAAAYTFYIKVEDFT